MPFFAQGNSLGGGGVGRKSRRKRFRDGALSEVFSVLFSNGNIDLSIYGKVEKLDLFTISPGNNGNSGSNSRSGGPSGPGGPGGTSGIVRFTPTPYSFAPGASLGSVPVSTSPPASPSNGPGSSISVPAPIQSDFPGFTFTPGPSGSNGQQPQSWAGGGGGGGAGGINISHPSITIPSVSANAGQVGGTAHGPEVRPGGTGGGGGTGYGAGGGGGGGGGESHGTTAGGGGGGTGAPGIIIAKISYKDVEEFFF